MPDTRVDDALLDASNQLDPSLAADGAGGVYVAYVETALDAGDIWIVISSDGGVSFPFRTRVDDDTGTRRQSNPSLAVDGAGVLYIAWEGYNAVPPTDSEIRFSRSLDGGVTWGDGVRNNNDLTLNNDPTGFQLEPALVPFGAGTVHVTWTDNRRGKSDTFFSTSTDSGVTWLSPNIRVNPDAGPDPVSQPAIAVDAAGIIFIANRDNRGNDENIFVARSLDGGLSWGQNVRVNDDQGKNRQTDPAIAVLGATVYVIWIDARSGPNRVYSSRSLDAGLTWGDAIMNNNNDVRVDDGPGSASNPALILTGTAAHAVWADNRLGQNDLFSSLSTDGAQTWGDGLVNNNDVLVNDDPTWSTADQDLPDLIAVPGGACAAWQDNREANYDILFSCRSAGVWGNGRRDSRDVVAAGWGTPTPLDQVRPHLASTGGWLHAVWEDQRLGNFGIYASSSSDGGSTWGDGLVNGNDLRVDDASLGDQDHASLAVSLSGVLGAAWRDARLPFLGTDIRFASSPDGGVTWGNGVLDNGDARVNDDLGSAAQDWPSVAALPNGTFIVAWEDRRSGAGNPDIYLAYSLNGGVTWSPNVRVDDDPGTSRQERPSITADTAGVVHVAYADWRTGDSDIRHTSCVLDGVGVTCGDGVPDNDVLVSDDPTGAQQGTPRIRLALGGLAVAYEDTRSGDSDIRASTSPDGLTWGDGLPGNDALVHGNVSGNEVTPALAGDAAALHAGWADATLGDVWSSRTRNGTGWAVESIPSDPLAAAATQRNLDLALDATSLFAIWDDDRSGTPDIYFSRAPRIAPPPPVLALILLTPPGPIDLVPNQTVGFTVVGYDTDLSLNQTWIPSWALTDGRGSLGPPGGNASAGFLVDYTAVLEGWDNVTVGNGTVSARAVVNITARPLPLARIDLVPATASLNPGAGATFVALGYDTAGFLNTTWTPLWSTPTLGTTANPGGSASAGWTLDYLAGCAAGADSLSVSNGTVSAASAILISPGPLAEIRLTPWPGPVTVTVNGFLGFNALGFDACGNQNLTWGPPGWVTGPLGVLVTSGGNSITGYLATYRAGTLVGADWIQAIAGARANTTAITIVSGGVARLELFPSPGPIELPVDGTAAFVAFAYDAFGNRNFSWLPTWSTGPLGSHIPGGGNPAIGFRATFRAGTAAGTDFLRVSAGSASNTTTIRIRPGPMERLELNPWPGPIPLGTASELLLTAGAFDRHGNPNESWSPDWGTTDGRGVLFGSGGDAVGGYYIRYQAGATTGPDNVTVAVAGTGLTNRTRVQIIVPPQIDILARIELTPWPATQVICLFGSVPFLAFGYDRSGAPNLTWTPNWEAGPLGAVTGVGGDPVGGYSATFQAGAASGSTSMRVHAAGIQKLTPVTILSDPLVRLELVPPPIALVHLLDSLELTALGYDQYGNLNLSWTPTWTNTAQHGVLGNFAGNAQVGFRATFTAGTSVGFDTVSVNYGAIRNATILDVIAGPLHRITLDPWPGPIILNPASSQTYLTRGYDRFGNVNQTWDPDWVTTNGRGSLAETGGDPVSGFTAVFTAGALEGLDNITVRAGSVRNASSVFVLFAGALAFLELLPSPVEMTLGENVTFSARGFDAQGRVNTSWQAFWSLSGGGVGTLSRLRSPYTGLFQADVTAGALGTVFLTVTSNTGLTNTSRIDVVDRAPPITRVATLPPYTADLSVSLQVNATDPGGSGLDRVEVWYRRNAESYRKFGDFAPGRIDFPLPADGRYDFYSVGIDRAGNREVPPGSPDAWIIRDTVAPTVLSATPGSGLVDPGGFRLEVTFSEPVVPSSVLLLVTAGSRTWSVRGDSLPWRGDTVLWDIALGLPHDVVLQVTVVDASDLAGNDLSPAYAWDLRTAPTPQVLDLGLPALLALVVATILVLFLLGRRRRDEEEDELDETPEPPEGARVETEGDPD